MESSIGPSTGRSPIGTSSGIRPRRRARRTSCWSSSTTPDSGTRARSAARSRRRTTPASPRAALRYNRFHVTALCSPTRAALLTGRNNHAVGFGSIGEFAGGFPGYSAILPRDCAPLPRILRDNGYSTAAFGKWHLTPDGQQGPAGPFDRWPNGWGFDYFYGILGGGSSQWDPVPGGEPEDHRHRPAVLRRGKSVLLPGRDGRPHDRVAARRARAGRAQAVLRVLLDRLQPRPAPRREGVGRQVQGEVRPGMGQAPRGDVRRARRSSASFPPTPSSRRATRRSRRGTTFPTS